MMSTQYFFAFFSARVKKNTQVSIAILEATDTPLVFPAEENRGQQCLKLD
jgi:hypothetical protein